MQYMGGAKFGEFPIGRDPLKQFDSEENENSIRTSEAKVIFKTSRLRYAQALNLHIM